MTSTTRTLTFRHEPGGNLLFRASTDEASPGFPLAVTTDKSDSPLWSMLDADAVEDLHELTGLILKGRDRVVDASIMCGAISGNGTDCALEVGHSHQGAEGDPFEHVDLSGAHFVEF